METTTGTNSFSEVTVWTDLFNLDEFLQKNSPNSTRRFVVVSRELFSCDGMALFSALSKDAECWEENTRNAHHNTTHFRQPINSKSFFCQNPCCVVLAIALWYDCASEMHRRQQMTYGTIISLPGRVFASGTSKLLLPSFWNNVFFEKLFHLRT